MFGGVEIREFLTTWILETDDENLRLPFWLINQKGSLLESKVKLEVITICHELENEVLYVSLT